MEVECSHDGGDALRQRRLNQEIATKGAVVSPRRASRYSKERGGRNRIPRAAAPPPLIDDARTRQRQRQRQRPSEKRELRWLLPVNDHSGSRQTGVTAAAAALGEDSATGGPSAAARSQGSTNPFRRRTRSSSPPIPAPSSQQQGEQEEQRLSRGGGVRRRHSSLGPSGSKRRSEGVPATEAAAAGAAATPVVLSRELRRRRRRRAPQELRAAEIALNVAQQAAEDLLSSPPAYIGALLLVVAFAVSCGRLVMFLALLSIVLATGAALWVRSAPAAAASGARPGRAGGAGEVTTDGGGSGGDEGITRGEEGGDVESLPLPKWRSAMVALACAPSALNAATQYYFLRLAARTGSVWLALGLSVISLVYACWVGASVVVMGAEKLKRGGVKFRNIVASWYALLLAALAAAASQRQQQLGKDTLSPSGIAWLAPGPFLLALAAWQLGKVSARHVEHSVRYGLVVTLHEALGKDPDHELSAASLLKLAAGRWLVAHWSQPPTFSAPELREMLVRAVSSIALERRLFGSIAGKGDDGGSDSGSLASTVASTVASTGSEKGWEHPEPSTLPSAERVLTEWLQGRVPEPPMIRLEFPWETSKPVDVAGWTRLSLEAVILLRACPSSCVMSAVLLLGALTGAPWGACCARKGWAFLLPLVGPAVVEACGVQVLLTELRRKRKARPPHAAPPATAGTAAGAAADDLSLFLEQVNPRLANVWCNALRAVEKLREEKLIAGDADGAGGAGSVGVVDGFEGVARGVGSLNGGGRNGTENGDASRASSVDGTGGPIVAEAAALLAAVQEKQNSPRLDSAARRRAERVVGQRPRLLKDYLTYSRPRSADSPVYPGRFTGSRTNNSLGLGLSRPLLGSSGAPSTVSTVAVAAVRDAAPAPADIGAGSVGDEEVRSGVEANGVGGGAAVRSLSTPALVEAGATAAAVESPPPPRARAPPSQLPVPPPEEEASSTPASTTPRAAQGTADLVHREEPVTAPAAAPPASETATAARTAPDQAAPVSMPVERAAAAAASTKSTMTARNPDHEDPVGNDWDLFGATWAGTVVGAAGDLAGALGDVAGGALGSIPVVGGVLEWWGGGGGGAGGEAGGRAQEKSTNAESAQGQKLPTVVEDAGVEGDVEALSEDEAPEVVAVCDGGGGGGFDGGSATTGDSGVDGGVTDGVDGSDSDVESSDRQASVLGGEESAFTAGDGNASAQVKGGRGSYAVVAEEDAKEAEPQDQAAEARDEATPPLDDASVLPETKAPESSKPTRGPALTTLAVASSAVGVGGDGLGGGSAVVDNDANDGVGHEERPRETGVLLSGGGQQGETTAAAAAAAAEEDEEEEEEEGREVVKAVSLPSPLYTIMDPTPQVSAAFTEGGGDSCRGKGKGATKGFVERPRAEAGEGHGGEREEEVGETEKEEEERKDGKAKDGEKEGEKQGSKSGSLTEMSPEGGPEKVEAAPKGKQQEAESDQLSLTGMAWWTVSRAVEFAGGAAYIFVPGFEKGKDGERGGDGDGKAAKASEGEGSVGSDVVG